MKDLGEFKAGNERSLVRKLSEVMAAVERVEKKGHNAHFNYDFVRETDMLAAVRPEFAKRQLLMTMSAQHEHAKQNGNILTVPYIVTIYDGESGETLAFTVLGAGQDTQDKGPYKALTGAVKYALMKLLLIDTGDDPENENHQQPRASSAPHPARPTQTSDPYPTQTTDAQVVSHAKVITSLVVSVTQLRAQPPAKWVRYNIEFAVGLKASTFSETYARIAKEAQEKQLPVVVRYKTGAYGPEVDELHWEEA